MGEKPIHFQLPQFFFFGVEIYKHAATQSVILGFIAYVLQLNMYCTYIHVRGTQKNRAGMQGVTPHRGSRYRNRDERGWEGLEGGGGVKSGFSQPPFTPIPRYSQGRNRVNPCLHYRVDTIHKSLVVQAPTPSLNYLLHNQHPIARENHREYNPRNFIPPP